MMTILLTAGTLNSHSQYPRISLEIAAESARRMKAADTRSDAACERRWLHEHRRFYQRTESKLAQTGMADTANLRGPVEDRSNTSGAYDALIRRSALHPLEGRRPRRPFPDSGTSSLRPPIVRIRDKFGVIARHPSFLPDSRIATTSSCPFRLAQSVARRPFSSSAEQSAPLAIRSSSNSRLPRPAASWSGVRPSLT